MPFLMERYARIPRGVTDPRALASIFEKAEAELARTQHPDPYRRKLYIQGAA
jgi:NADH dehydrogenase (ubiquinone) 1 beta subcomplex subunit 9